MTRYKELGLRLSELRQSRDTLQRNANIRAAIYWQYRAGLWRKMREIYGDVRGILYEQRTTSEVVRFSLNMARLAKQGNA